MVLFTITALNLVSSVDEQGYKKVMRAKPPHPSN